MHGNCQQESCYRRENRAMPLYISIRIEFYNGTVRFLCHSKHFLSVFVCRLQWIIWQKVTSTIERISWPRNQCNWLTFLSLLVWVYPHSNLCSGLQKTHLLCTRVRFGRSRSFMAIQGRWFWYQSKARMRLPICPSLWLWSYLAPFLRYGDLLAKNCLFLLHFPYPSLIQRSRSPCSLWNFALKLTVRKLESWDYPSVKTAWS